MEFERHDTHAVSYCSSDEHSYKSNEEDKSDDSSEELIEVKNNENSTNSNEKNYYKELFQELSKKNQNLFKKYISQNMGNTEEIKFPINYYKINKNLHFFINPQMFNNYNNNIKKQRKLFDIHAKNEKKTTEKEINHKSPKNNTVNTDDNKKNNNIETKPQLEINEFSLKIEADHIITFVIKPINTLCYMTKCYLIPKSKRNSCLKDDLKNEKLKTIESPKNNSKTKAKSKKSKSCDEIIAISTLENFPYQIKHKRALSCVACQKRLKDKESIKIHIYNKKVNETKLNQSEINKSKNSFINIKINNIKNRCLSSKPKNTNFKNSLYKDNTFNSIKTSNSKNNSCKNRIIYNSNEFNKSIVSQKKEYKSSSNLYKYNTLKSIGLYLNRKINLNKTINQNTPENSMPILKNSILPKKTKWESDFSSFYENVNNTKLTTLKKNNSDKNFNKNSINDNSLHKQNGIMNYKYDEIMHKYPEILLGKHTGTEEDCPICKATRMRMKLNNKVFFDDNNINKVDTIKIKKNKFIFTKRLKTPRTLLNIKEKKLIREIQTFLKYTKNK